MGEILTKHLERVFNIGPEQTLKQIKSNSQFIKLLADEYKLNGRIGVLQIIRQADAHLTDTDVATVSDAVISQIFANRVGQGSRQATAYGTWRSTEGGKIDDMIAQISQPKGG